MLYEGTKMVVGGLLAAIFAVPLVTVARHRTLWEEPMAMLAASLSLVSLICGLALAAAGLYDLVELQWADLCLAIQSAGIGAGVSMKMAYVTMAVDQFVAVVRPLQHYQVMERALRWLLGAVGLSGALMFAVGMVTGWLGLTTVAERMGATGNGTQVTAAYDGCRWENFSTHVANVTAETAIFTLALTATALFVYTGVVGWRTKVRLTRISRRQRCQPASRHHQSFMYNFKSFQRICLVLSLTLVLDVVGSLVRLADRWYSMPRLSGFIHQGRMLGFIFEGWAYGLLNAKMRAAYRSTLCRCRPRDVAGTPPAAPAPGNGGDPAPSGETARQRAARAAPAQRPPTAAHKVTPAPKVAADSPSHRRVSARHVLTRDTRDAWLT
ncbi:hypothetical protein FJT64_001683 [Amphibalanus amphitrite]|uniref:G-protein coupled receptors family 1 profile domain-containing protein n=1 Tax=Amphibalanus amphitrite TaxID=1232801 RepID=A0A6A4XAA9_AMPAM|nr:hypothetical protein FJT64_001683 [Amphibalanus amphitrite]